MKYEPLIAAYKDLLQRFLIPKLVYVSIVSISNNTPN